MSSSATNNNNQVAANALPENPFSNWKSTIDLDKNNTAASDLPNDVATLILSYLPIEQVQTIMESSETQMDRYYVYRGVMGDVDRFEHTEHTKSSYTGKELEKFQRLLSLKGQAFINGQPPVIKSWAELLAGDEMSLTRLKNLDLSDATNMTDLDVIALTRSSPNLTKLVLPGAFPSDEVMAVLKVNCPHALIYPSAMTEYEWAHPAEFMAKLPPPPQAIEDFINSPRPIWEGKTAAEMHIVVPRVNKIVRNIGGRSWMLPWTLNNVNWLDKETGGPGCQNIWDEILKPDHDTPPEVGFEWVVFTKDILPQSRNQIYDEQEGLAEHWGYEVPGFLDATTCMLWENRISGNRIYNNIPWTFTRCQERGIDWQLIAGGFAPRGVTVFFGSNYAGNDIGIGGLKKFNG